MILVWLEIEDDVLAHSPDGRNVTLFEYRGNLRRRRLERLLLLREPDGLHDVSGNTLGEAAGNAFDFGQFGHRSSIGHYKNNPASSLPDRLRDPGLKVPESALSPRIALASHAAVPAALKNACVITQSRTCRVLDKDRSTYFGLLELTYSCTGGGF